MVRCRYHLFVSIPRGGRCPQCVLEEDSRNNEGEQAAAMFNDMAAAFNEWMRRYTEEPQRFEAEFKTVSTFLSEAAAGKKPTYGEECAIYLIKIMNELKD